MASVKKPTLLINRSICKKNIEKMKDKADRNNMLLRPHFKTHQNVTIAGLFKDAGIDKCTVSSVEMAEYFAGNGWQDITLAFPVNLLEIADINKLNKKIGLNLLVESVQSVNFLAEHLSEPLELFIKIDTGYHRTGIWAKDFGKIEEILEEIKKHSKLKFAGLLTHAGHSYQARSRAEILQIHQESTKLIKAIKDKLHLKGIISIGDTPTSSLVEDFKGIDELRCGNFVYYDLMQYYLGACAKDEIAVKVACPIVALHPVRNEVIIYGGGIHFSKESLLRNGKQIYGETVTGKGYLRSLSQEHGILHFASGIPSELKIGETVEIYPIHSCLTANLLKKSIKFQT